MIRSAVTISLVPQAAGGPFVFWDDLGAACEQAARLGFDAVEVFASGPTAVDRDQLRHLTQQYGLSVAAVGTGAGAIIQGLTLTDASPDRRSEAISFIKAMIDFGAEFKAPAIIGSMQGRWNDSTDRETALKLLRDALRHLGQHAKARDVPLVFEPLNRYESNLINTLAETVAFLRETDSDNVKILADLFHMNIEEVDIAAAFREASEAIGHVHFVDSNRQAAGRGHTDFQPIASALHEIGYSGYLSAEAFPLPSSFEAAETTIATFREHFPA